MDETVEVSEELWMGLTRQEEVFLFEIASVEEGFFLSYLLLLFSVLGVDDVFSNER